MVKRHAFPLIESLNVGATYEMRGLALVRSSKSVAERTLANSSPADPNLATGLVPGKAALPCGDDQRGTQDRVPLLAPRQGRTRGLLGNLVRTRA